MNKKDLEFIIKEGEGQFIEFKDNFSDEVIESLVAFANYRGGKVIIGIDRNKVLKGVSINEESVKDWINEIKTKTFHALLPISRIKDINGKKIVIFEVHESSIKPVSIKGKYFVRRENSNHLMTAQEIASESFNSLNKSFDAILVDGFSINDLDFAEIKRTIRLINKRKEVKIKEDIKEFLLKYNLIREGKLTLASLLLFSNKFASRRIVKVGVFQSDLIIKDEIVCDTYLLLQAEELLEFVKKHISKMTFIVSKPQNVQKWEYPLEALRELIINLIVHRDYNQTATIKIFPDKLTFLNYGGLPEGYKIEDFIFGKRSSYIRNKLITKVFKDAGIIEEYSSGLARVLNLCKENSNKKPLFTFDRTSFSVELESLNKKNLQGKWQETTPQATPQTTPQAELTELENKIVSKIKKNSKVSRSELAKSLEISSDTIKEYLEKLKNKGIIKRIGKTSAGYWQIIKLEKDDNK